MGTLASIVGIFVGLGLGVGLFKLFDAVGFTLPNNGLLLHTRTVIVALLVGIDRHAARQPPARVSGPRGCRRSPPCARARRCREGRFARFRAPWSIGLAVLGFAALGLRPLGGRTRHDEGAAFMGLGTLLIFFGVALFRADRPAARSGDRVAVGDGSAGRAGIAGPRQRRRNPQRTGVDRSALMIGLALVTLVAVLATAITREFRGAVDRPLVSGYAITAENNFDPIPIAAGRAAAKAPGVRADRNVRVGDGRSSATSGSPRPSTRKRPGSSA